MPELYGFLTILNIKIMSLPQIYKLAAESTDFAPRSARYPIFIDAQ
jgi:hypothetical protein